MIDELEEVVDEFVGQEWDVTSGEARDLIVSSHRDGVSGEGRLQLTACQNKYEATSAKPTQECCSGPLAQTTNGINRP